MANDNKQLGQFNLEGIPPAPRGLPQIEVTFDIDANGIVSVSAKDKATGKEQQITIQADGGLTDEDIKKMMADAEANAGADKARRELVEAKNNAEALVHQTEKQVEEHGDKVSAEIKGEIAKAVEELKTSREGDNVGDIQAKHQALMTAAMKLGEAIYANQQESEAHADASADGAAGGDDVVDADFEEVDDAKSA
jgi:molecular chaperone DnaK